MTKVWHACCWYAPQPYRSCRTFKINHHSFSLGKWNGGSVWLSAEETHFLHFALPAQLLLPLFLSWVATSNYCQYFHLSVIVLINWLMIWSMRCYMMRTKMTFSKYLTGCFISLHLSSCNPVIACHFCLINDLMKKNTFFSVTNCPINSFSTNSELGQICPCIDILIGLWVRQQKEYFPNVWRIKCLTVQAWQLLKIPPCVRDL